MRRERSASSLGAFAGIAAYSLWGLFPLYFHALEPTAPIEILAHRIVWVLLLMLAVLAATHRLGELSSACRNPQHRWRLAAAGLLISANWLTYVWAVANERVVDASLGYFINPLMTVALGVVVLGESVRRLQLAAIGFGSIAVAVLVVAHGEVPWIGLLLATTFSAYSLLKKTVEVDPIVALAAETSVVAPFAAAGLIIATGSGTSTFLHGSVSLDLRLIGLGVVTALPLLLFAVAARRLTLVTVGVMQYLTPFALFLLGWLRFGEEVPPERLAGFAFTWIALVLLTADAIAARPARGPLPSPAPR